MNIAFIILAVAGVSLLCSVLFVPKVRLGHRHFDTYWVAALICAVAVWASGIISAPEIWAGITAHSAVNPLKILVLFLSMTALSIYLDEAGVFRYLAAVAVRRSKGGQWSLFWHLYVAVSVLTVFTSNDVIILTFTPFICYFARSAGINPLPYLFGEFAAANTWSMALIIGNPTNIYLATNAGIDFVEYMRVMLLPTIAGGVTAFVALWLLFRRELSRPMLSTVVEPQILNRSRALIGIMHFAACLLLLVASSWTGLEMWSVTLAILISLTVVSLVLGAVSKSGYKEIRRTYRRLPWPLIPFVLGMFVIVLALDHTGGTAEIARVFGSSHTVAVYGIGSFFASNIINNIPMSVLFSSIIEQGLVGTTLLQGTYAAIVGSNLGALLSPVGALAGLMWASILHTHSIEISYRGFVWRGAAVGIPALAATLLVLNLII